MVGPIGRDCAGCASHILQKIKYTRQNIDNAIKNLGGFSPDFIITFKVSLKCKCTVIITIDTAGIYIKKKLFNTNTSKPET